VSLIGDFRSNAIPKRIIAAINNRSAKKMNGSAKGKPYLAPTKPVLHKRTKMYGAKRETFNKLG
jgi:hypothetical protein